MNNHNDPWRDAFELLVAAGAAIALGLGLLVASVVAGLAAVVRPLVTAMSPKRS